MAEMSHALSSSMEEHSSGALLPGAFGPADLA